MFVPAHVTAGSRQGRHKKYTKIIKKFNIMWEKDTKIFIKKLVIYPTVKNVGGASPPLIGVGINKVRGLSRDIQHNNKSNIK